MPGARSWSEDSDGDCCCDPCCDFLCDTCLGNGCNACCDRCFTDEDELSVERPVVFSQRSLLEEQLLYRSPPPSKEMERDVARAAVSLSLPTSQEMERDAATAVSLKLPQVNMMHARTYLQPEPCALQRRYSWP
jgi:hypothetical protein